MKQKNHVFEELSNLATALNDSRHTFSDISIVLMLWDHSTGDVTNFLYGNAMKQLILIAEAIVKMADSSDGRVSTDTLLHILKSMCKHQEEFKDEYKGD